jgi:integral membrane sensor domain MASE1
MNILKLVIGLGIFLLVMAFAVSIPYGAMLFNQALSDQAVDLIRLALIVLGFVAVFAGVIEK